MPGQNNEEPRILFQSLLECQVPRRTERNIELIEPDVYASLAQICGDGELALDGRRHPQQGYERLFPFRGRSYPAG